MIFSELSFFFLLKDKGKLMFPEKKMVVSLSGPQLRRP